MLPSTVLSARTTEKVAKLAKLAMLAGSSGTLNGRLPDDAPIFENLMMNLTANSVQIYLFGRLGWQFKRNR